MRCPIEDCGQDVEILQTYLGGRYYAVHGTTQKTCEGSGLPSKKKTPPLLPAL